MSARRIAATAVLIASSLSSRAIADRARAVARDVVAPEPSRLEASGFVGLSSFGDSQLGNSWAPEQTPRSSALLGARLGWRAVPSLAGRASLVLEAEFALAPAFTGRSSAPDEPARMSYFAPVFGWRAHALVRLPLGPLALHALAGGGGASVASRSPFMAKETDPLGYAGLGAAVAIAGRWQLRLDGREGVMPGRTSKTTRVSELQLGLTTTFGIATRVAKRRPPPPPPPPELPPEVADDTDTDGDGLPDRLDHCPKEPETINGIADEDGCPEPDPDGDGIIGDADKCPMEPEDIDHFEDEDGCPDRDNDRDGIEDVRDVCPNEAETKNGYADSDGCPDLVPEAIVSALAGASAVRFDARRARVPTDAKRALQPVLAVLEADTDLAIVIVGIPERAGGEDLAKRRAEAVKWSFVDLGIAEDRIDTEVGLVGGQSAPQVVLRLRVAQAPGP